MCASEEGTINAFSLYFDITSRNNFNPDIIKNIKIFKNLNKIEIN